MNIRSKDDHTTRVELGDRVRDCISGFEGIVTGITIFVAGCKRVGVTANGLKDDGEPIGEVYFDEPNLQIIDKNVLHSPKRDTPKIKLGDRAKDKITGFKGIATSVTHHLWYDSHVGLTPTELKNGKPIDSVSFPDGQLEKLKNQQVKEPTKGRETGGDQKVPRRIY